MRQSARQPKVAASRLLSSFALALLRIRRIHSSHHAVVLCIVRPQCWPMTPGCRRRKGCDTRGSPICSPPQRRRCRWHVLGRAPRGRRGQAPRGTAADQLLRKGPAGAVLWDGFAWPGRSDRAWADDVTGPHRASRGSVSGPSSRAEFAATCPSRGGALLVSGASANSPAQPSPIQGDGLPLLPASICRVHPPTGKRKPRNGDTAASVATRKAG